MRNPTKLGPYWDITLVPSPTDPHGTARLGVLQDTFVRLREYVLATAIAQYYGIIQDGFMYARTMHLFKGLKRPLLHEGNVQGDRDVLIYSWVPRWDYEWKGSRSDGTPERRQPPPNRTFVVLARQLLEPDEHGVIGTILHWNWVEEDRTLKAAPISWEERYTEQLWTRYT